MPIEQLISVSGSRRFYKSVEITETQTGTLKFDFPYDEYLKDEIKVMDGARWNPDGMFWSVKNSRRNQFQLDFLRGKNPYSWYDRNLLEWTPRVETLYPQQDKMGREAITYRQVLWAAEMGLGKTLAALMAIEWGQNTHGYDDWWWVGPKSALASFDVEVAKWGLKCYPTKVMTYDELVKIHKSGWPTHLPIGVFYDEFSRCKTPTAQRTQAAMSLAESLRDAYGENEPFIVGMTGTPAPKTPLDWFSQCEIIKPGFIREGNIHKFRDRLAVVVKKKNEVTGGVYPQVLAWRDSEDKCSLCGCNSMNHDFEVMGLGVESHKWTRGANEVARLYKRMKGLVSVYFKKEWLSHLPDKQYRVLRCKVSRATKNAAKQIQSTARSAIQALTMLRELSDGFLYQEETQGTMTCPLCVGSCRTLVPMVPEQELGQNGIPIPFNPTVAEEVKMVEVDCTMCGATGEVPRIVRIADTVGSPKDTLLEEILDDHYDDGRLVVYAGFTGSIDRVVSICERKDWKWIRVDGRGWNNNLGLVDNSPRGMLDSFQNDKEGAERLVFIGHPGSAGMGLTLTASSEIVYYSNDFNAESRIQSEDRIHRPGMDINKGAMITDLVHLDSDLLVLDNLKKKRRLQDMSLGQFQASLQMMDEDRLS